MNREGELATTQTSADELADAIEQAGLFVHLFVLLNILNDKLDVGEINDEVYQKLKAQIERKTAQFQDELTQNFEEDIPRLKTQTEVELKKKEILSFSKQGMITDTQLLILEGRCKDRIRDLRKS